MLTVAIEGQRPLKPAIPKMLKSDAERRAFATIGRDPDHLGARGFGLLRGLIA